MPVYGIFILFAFLHLIDGSDQSGLTGDILLPLKACL